MSSPEPERIRLKDTFSLGAAYSHCRTLPCTSTHYSPLVGVSIHASHSYLEIAPGCGAEPANLNPVPIRYAGASARDRRRIPGRTETPAPECSLWAAPLHLIIWRLRETRHNSACRLPPLHNRGDR